MKKILCIAALLSVGTHLFAQQKAVFSGKQFTKKGSAWYSEEGYEVNSRILTVKLKSGVSTTALSSARRGMKIVRSNQLGFIDIQVPEGTDVISFAETLRQQEGMELVEVNTFGAWIDVIPTDSGYASQWHLPQISAPAAWDQTMGDPSVLVAIIDSGVDWAHMDLGTGFDSYENIWKNPGEDAWSNPLNAASGNHIDDDGNGLIDDWKGWNFAANTNDSRSSFSHGTEVSGVVAAKTNNSNNRGVAGIAGGNNAAGARLMPFCIGITAPDGSVLDDAILYAVSKGAKVIQLSLTVAQTAAINAAIQTAVNNNVTVVCASGNNNGAVGYPANNANVIAVGATDNTDHRASFSNYGSTLFVSAPGVNIYTTRLSNGRGSNSGTSFSAPIVSGVIALMLSVDPSLTTTQIRNVLAATADKVGGYTYTNGKSNELGYGRINAAAAVAQLLPAVTGPDAVCPTGTFQLSYVPAGATVTWSVSNPAIASVSAAGVVTRISGGAFNVIAGITRSGITTTVSKSVSALSTPPNTPTFATIVPPTCSNPEVVLSANPVSSDSRRWTVLGSTPAEDYELFETAPWTVLVPAEAFFVRLTVTNACGSSFGVRRIARPACLEAFSISPNPAGNTISIRAVSITKANAKTSSATKRKEIRTVRIYDIKGALVKQQFFTTGADTAHVDVAQLPDGTYIIEVSDGVYKETHKSIIRH